VGLARTNVSGGTSRFHLQGREVLDVTRDEIRGTERREEMRLNERREEKEEKGMKRKKNKEKKKKRKRRSEMR
jgi:hypothetical protein